MTEQEAEAILRSVPGYDWILNDGRLFWTPQDLAYFLGVVPQTIKNWVDAGMIPGALNLGGAGMRIPRGGVLIYLASKLPGSQSITG